MTTSNLNISTDLPALPLPRVFLLYGKADQFRQKLLGQNKTLFQWRFGAQQRIDCIGSADDPKITQEMAKAALKALKGKPFKPVMIFDQGESCDALEIFDYNLPDFAIIEAADDPEEVEYVLCNPEASLESIWYPLLEGEAIAEPPAIWRDPKFLGNYGEAFLQWLRHHPERHGMEPLADLKLNDFTIDIPQPEGYYRLAHQFFPLAWLDIKRVNDSWLAKPGGALDGVDSDELSILHDNESIVLADMPGDIWEERQPTLDSAQVLPFPTKTRRPVFVAHIPAIRAAADGKTKITPPPYDGNELKIGDTEEVLLGEYTVSCEDLPFDPDYQQLVFECSSGLLDKLGGKSVEIVVNKVSTKLEAVVGRRGLAKGKIPRNLDLSAGYAVHFYTPEDEGKSL